MREADLIHERGTIAALFAISEKPVSLRLGLCHHPVIPGGRLQRLPLPRAI